jgi:predicted PurR-regulated permease PerM
MQQPASNPSPALSSSRAVARRGSIFTREPVLLLGLMLAAFYFGRPILIPLALALTFAFLLTPLVTRVQRMRFRRTPAALVVLCAATAVLAGIIWLVAGQLLTVVNGLPSHEDNIRAKLVSTHIPADSSLGQALVNLEGLSRELSTDPTQKAVPQSLLTSQSVERSQRASRDAAASRARAARDRSARAELSGQQKSSLASANTGLPQAAADEGAPTPVVVVQPTTTELEYLLQIARPALAPIGAAVMVLIFTVYLLIKREDLRNRMLLLAGIGRLNLVSHALDDAGERISRYLIANVSVNAGIGVVFAAGLYAIGIPYAALWGALLGLLRTVPYIGPLIGGVLPTLFALVYFPQWWQAGCVLALIALLEILVSNFLEPWLYGSHTGISPLALLVMAILWTLLWGWPGLLLSTPLTVCLIVVGRTMPQLSFLHILLGDDAKLAPEARFYERMLALDQREAHSIAYDYLEQPDELLRGADANLQPDRRSPLDLYDSIVLPALMLAETDRHKGAVEDHRAALFMQGASELIAELTGYAGKRQAGEGDDPAPVRMCCPVVCIPASDQADEIAAIMLAQLLEVRGHKTLLLPPAALTPELLQRFAEDPQTTLCISALPPFAFSGAHAVYRRLRAAIPRNRILIAMWRSHIDPEALRQRFAMDRADDAIVVSLAEAMSTIEGSVKDGSSDGNSLLPGMYARPRTARAAAAR